MFDVLNTGKRKMGASYSASELQEIHRICDNFLLDKVPLFLESEYCEIGEGNWMDPTTFMTAFHSFLRLRRISVPEGVSYHRDFAKHYFNVLKKDGSIYASGAPGYYTIVGVKLVKWPGNKKTDAIAGFVNKQSF